MKTLILAIALTLFCAPAACNAPAGGPQHGFLGNAPPGGAPSAPSLAGPGLVASGGKLVNPAALDYSGTAYYFTDEMLYGNPNFSGGSGPWQRTATGTGTASTNLTGTATGSRFGLVSLATGSTATGSVAWNLDQGMLDLTSLTVTSEATVGITALSSGTDEFEDFVGLADTNNSINLTNGCGFLYDRGNTATGGTNTSNEADWECVCANNGTRTIYVMDGTATSDESFKTVAAPLGVITFPGTNNWFSLKIVITPGTRAEFYVANGSGYVKSCDISTNLPSTSSRAVGPLFLHIKSAGLNSRVLYLDRYHLEVDQASARHL